MELNYLPINIDDIDKRPDKFSVELSGQQYIFTVAWNPEAEIFTFSVEDEEGQKIIQGRKIVYGVDMFENILEGPDVEIYPLDKTGQAEAEGITFDNFMDSVKPYIAGDN